jgi:putative nucleotidyltransferase-like protein
VTPPGDPLDDGQGLWRAVDELVDRARSTDGLIAHRLHLLAGARLRRRGRAVPVEIVREEELAAVASLAAASVLADVRAAASGPLLLMKGVELAARYPEPILRPLRDVDLLVPDAARTEAELLRAGFEPLGDRPPWANPHHRPPLVRPGLPIVVEVHERPKWPGRGPPVEALLARAVASRAAAGVLTLPPERHAVLVAAHSWAHRPLRRLLDLLDVAALVLEADRRTASEIASRWGVPRIWETTLAVADALFSGGRAPWPLRVWARDLPAVRRRTVLEQHLEHVAAPFASLPTGAAARASLHELARDLRPAPGETWRDKAQRSGRALRNALGPEPASEQERDTAALRR